MSLTLVALRVCPRASADRCFGRPSGRSCVYERIKKTADSTCPFCKRSLSVAVHAVAMTPAAHLLSPESLLSHDAVCPVLPPPATCTPLHALDLRLSSENGSLIWMPPEEEVTPPELFMQPDGAT